MGRQAHSRKGLLRALAQALITHESIETSFGRAKVLRPYVEKLVTTAKGGDLHARRELMKVFTVSQPIDKLLAVLGPRYKERPGGYTRLIKMGTRQGDAAETAVIEFV